MIAPPVAAPRRLRPPAEAGSRPEPALVTAESGPEPPHQARLIGREREMALLQALIDDVPNRGSARLIRGAPGIGKSALLAALVDDVRAHALTILWASGNRTEANLPYAGLHQLVRPILGELASLPRPQRRAIETAFRLTSSGVPDPFLIAISTLQLLSTAAGTGAGLLVVVEDAQWLDRRTSDVLSFVARRLMSDPIVLLVTARDERRSPILDAGLDELCLDGLADHHAARLLSTARPDLDESVGQRLVQLADGNPLALAELPAMLTIEQLTGNAPLPDWIPLSARLQDAVGARMRDLPAVTRRLLRLLALGESSSIDDLLGAYETLYRGEPATADALMPAVVSGTVVLHERVAAFRDPLGRAAVYQATPVAERRAAEVAFATVRVPVTPMRSAEAAPPERPAQTDPIALGDAIEAGAIDPSSTTDLIVLAGLAIDAGDDLLARRQLWAAAQEVLWVSGDPDARHAARRAAQRLDGPPDDPWLLAISAALGSADPGSISEAARRYELRDAAPTDLLLVGISCAIAGDVARSRPMLARAAAGLRGDDDRGPLAQLLVIQAWNDLHLGRWAEARSEVQEGAQLAVETQQETWSLIADCVHAMVAGMQGDEPIVSDLVARVGAAAVAHSQGWLASTLEAIRGVADLNAGRADAAYASLRARLARAEGPGVWPIDHFADAALLTGSVEDGRTLLAAQRNAESPHRGPLRSAGLVYAEAVLADDATADERQLQAIADLAPWPIHRARLQLHRGAWLRRHRRASDSRAPLRSARDLFEAIGAVPLADRARRELRASGERSRQRDVTSWDQLSPQETEIAHLAANGLSNREIGERLFLSHRTVGAHLYRIFPKLGVTSRGQLHTVLEATDAHTRSGGPSLGAMQLDD